MKDPVVLPSGAIMDRAVIRNHISKFQIDPFTGDHLTEDMLVSDDNLKARIQDFISGMDPNDTNGAQSDPDARKKILSKTSGMGYRFQQCGNTYGVPGCT
ncbi:hypothetical protein MKX03_028659 [Papaver bracteatum]|nr:hypothetical protein MKX03_028659 [Papaver bracteatum]